MENFILSIDCKDGEYEIALAKSISRNSKGIIVKIKDSSGDVLLTDDFHDSNHENQSVFLLTENKYFEDYCDCKDLLNEDLDVTDKGFIGSTGVGNFIEDEIIFIRGKETENYAKAEDYCTLDSLRACSEFHVGNDNKFKDKGYKKIYKYDNVKNIIRYVIDEYAISKGVFFNPIPSNSTEVVTFFASSGGVGTTSVAISYAGEKSKYYGKRVLYLNLSCFDDSEKFLEKNKYRYAENEDFDGFSGVNTNKDNNISIRHFLYYLMGDKSFGYGSWDSFFTKDESGVSYFIPYNGLNPIVTLSNEEYEKFLGYLMERGDFDLIVIDGSNMPSEKLLRSIRLSDKSFEVRRFEQWHEYSGFEGNTNGDIYSYDTRTNSVSDRYFQDVLGENEYQNIPIIRNMFLYSEGIPADDISEDVKKHNAGKNNGSKILRKNSKAAKDKVDLVEIKNVKRKEFNVIYDPASFYYEEGIKRISLDKDFGMGIKDIGKI